MLIRAIYVAAILAVSLPQPAAAESGFFIAAGIGAAQLDESFDGFDVDADATAFRLTAGWRFNEHFAIEGGYQNLGRFEQTFDINGEQVDVSLKADGFTFGVVGYLPLGDRWSLLGRTGAFFWDGDADINSVSAASPEDANLFLGAGVAVALTERFALTADVTRFDLEDASSNVVSVGVRINF